MLSKKYKVKVVSVEKFLDGIYSVRLASLQRPFRYSPGQFLHLSLDLEYDGIGQWPDSRCFSIQSSPGENFIRITYAVKGRFTMHMEKSLQNDLDIWVKLPFGNLFTQPHCKKNTVFIAGGTGITPYLSLFKHNSFSEYLNPSIYLGFQSVKHNIYQKELSSININSSSTRSFIKKIFYEDMEGKIDIQNIFHEHGPKVSYFISGPPEMIHSFKRYLANKGTPNEYIFSDDWE